MNPEQNGAHTTKSKDRLPRKRKAAFGAGLMSYSLMNNGFTEMLYPFFNVCLGLNPVIIGWVTAGSRLYDAVTDPLMGSISDNTRSRMGRRRPYIGLGGLLGGLFFALLWWAPRGASDALYLGWLIGGSLLLYTAFTIFAVPYIAMSFELTPDYHERTRVMAYKVATGIVGGLAVATIYWITQRSIFTDTIDGMRWVGIGTGLVIIAFAILPTFFVKEHPMALRANNQEKVPLLESLKATFSRRSFLLVIGITVFLLISLSLVRFLGFYVNLYYVFGGDESASANVYLAAGWAREGSSLLSIPLVTWVSSHLGKRRTLFIFLSLALIGTLSKWVLYTPAVPYLQVIPNALMGAGMGATWLLINAMIPEICDEDELQTGVRRQGMFSGVYSWVSKTGLALSLAGTGYILHLTGFSADLGGNQAASTIWWMRFWFTCIPAIGFILSFIGLAQYPITEESAYRTRDLLEARNNNKPIET